MKRSGFVIENYLVDTTQPGDTFRSCRPTGRQRGYIYGVRMPVRFVMWLMCAWVDFVRKNQRKES